jgi:hypothetical protein
MKEPKKKKGVFAPPTLASVKIGRDTPLGLLRESVKFGVI